MKKIVELKIFVSLVSIAGLLALIFLSATMREFFISPSLPFSLNIFSSLGFLAGNGKGIEIPIWKFLAFGALLLMISIAALMLMDAEARKRLLIKLFRFLMTIIALWILLDYAYKRGSLSQLLSMIPTEAANTLTSQQASLPAYVQPEINRWLVFGISSLVGLAIVLLVWLVFFRKPKVSGLSPLEEIANIARDTLQELEPGRDWDEAIVRAYVRMSQAVSSERGIVRQLATTPSEYASRMEQAGLPAEAVRTLTLLFEGVRYGGRKASFAERDMAAAALSAILRACRVNA